MATRWGTQIPPQGAEPDPPRDSMSVASDGKWTMPYARRCQYGTAHSRRAGAVAPRSLETWTLFRRGFSRAKTCA